MPTVTQCHLTFFLAYPAAPKPKEYHHPVSQVHITQVASQKSPSLPTIHPSHKTRKASRKPQQQQKDFSSETDADPVFSLDDFTDDCEPFFESEEDDLSSGEKSKFSINYIMALNTCYLLGQRYPSLVKNVLTATCR